MKKKKVNVGGVAISNGIVFTSDYKQVTIQHDENNDIHCDIVHFMEDKNIIAHIPVLRGIVGLKNQVGNSASNFLEDIEHSKSRLVVFFMYALLIMFLITIPIIISIFFPVPARTIVQASGIVIEAGIYLVLLKWAIGTDNIFKYHGAEHKVVNAYQELGVENLNIENARKMSKIHKRCGGNFVVYFIVLLVLSTLIPIDDLLLKTICMIAMSVLNIGIACEIVNFVAILPKPLDIIGYPASLIQKITTIEPNDDMLKLAIYGIRGAIRENDKITPQEYINGYLKENRNIKKEIDVQDIYTVLEYLLHINRNDLILRKDENIISLQQEINADKLLNKYYKDKYPLQYITNKQYFYNEEYYVDENVLIPRSDTEILVEKAIEYINKEEIKTIIDLCTGSGAIGISIAKNSNVESVELIDISSGALNVANKNIKLNNVEDRVITRKSDLLVEKISQMLQEENTTLKVDMIVSNPPYIKSDVIPTLQKEVQKEPHLALDGGKTGLDFYIRILDEAKEVLKDNGILIMEIGYDQLGELKGIIEKHKEYKLLESLKDYGGNDRVIVCRFQEK